MLCALPLRTRLLVDLCELGGEEVQQDGRGAFDVGGAVLVWCRDGDAHVCSGFGHAAFWTDDAVDPGSYLVGMNDSTHDGTRDDGVATTHTENQ